MAEAIGIVGGGGHGKVVADLVRSAGHRLVGYIDADPQKLGMVVEPGGGTVRLGQEELLAALAVGALPPGLTGLALGVGDNGARFALLERIPRPFLPTLVHPTASVSPSAEIAAGTVVLAQAVINAGAGLGRGVIVNSGAIVEHDCRLEDAVHVSPGAVLGGGVRVGVRSWIGAGATILPGVTVGTDAIVGAGAVCVADVPSGATVAGNPARAIERRSS